MNISSDSKRILSFFLALKDLSDSLSEQEQKTLREIGKQLEANPKSWKIHTEPLLLNTIKNNLYLSSSYELYINKLENLDIPFELFQIDKNISPTSSDISIWEFKGFDKTDLSPKGYEEQLNNVVILVCSSEEPKKIVEEIGFIDRLKRFISGA